MRYRIRSLKPELFRDEKVQRLPRDARLLFVGLIAHADDEGRLDGDTRIIRSLVFPMDDLPLKTVDHLLNQISGLGLVYRYTADDYTWIEIRGWAKHQSVNRPTPSRIPSYASLNGRSKSEPEP